MNKHSDTHHPIGTHLPGPKARALIARDAEVVSPSYPREYPFVMSHGRGAASLGRGWQPLPGFRGRHRGLRDRPRASESRGRFGRPPQGRCISRVISGTKGMSRSASVIARSPMGEPAMSFFCQSGTEAVEGALKLARYVTGRPRFHRLSRRLPRPHHGLAGLHSRASTRSSRLFTTMPGVTHVPLPANLTGRCSPAPDQGEAVLDYIRKCCSIATCRRAKSPRSWSNRSRAKAATSCRPTGSWPGCASCATARYSADLRRSAIRRRPHRQDVRLRALGMCRRTS